MTSKYACPGLQLYYPGTKILVNKRGITNNLELEQINAYLFTKNLFLYTSALSASTVFDEQYFKNLHKDSLQSLYIFAGKYRQHNLSEGESTFCFAKYVEREMKKLFSDLQKEKYLKNFKRVSPEKFSERITYYMAELIAIHPFYEFNGRIIRMFFDLISYYNGYEYIDYLSFENDNNSEKNSFIQASIESFNGNNELLNKIIINGLKKR